MRTKKKTVEQEKNRNGQKSVKSVQLISINYNNSFSFESFFALLYTQMRLGCGGKSFL